MNGAGWLVEWFRWIQLGKQYRKALLDRELRRTAKADSEGR